MAPPVYDPHAERAFGHFTHALGKYLPARLTYLVKVATLIRATGATTKGKAR